MTNQPSMKRCCRRSCCHCTEAVVGGKLWLSYARVHDYAMRDFVASSPGYVPVEETYHAAVNSPHIVKRKGNIAEDGR